MKLERLLYRRRISPVGLVLFIIASTITVLYKTIKYILKSTVKFIKWFRNYRRFIESGYSYSGIYELINSMTGAEFEKFCYELFKALDYKVTATPMSCDGGKDLILYSEEDGYTYVECKRWSNIKVGRPELQKLVGASQGDNIDNMIFITTSSYNRNAYEYAKKIPNLELLDMYDIMKLVRKVDLKHIKIIFARTFANSNAKLIRLRPCNE